MAIAESFDRAAPTYDALRRKLIPCFDDFYDTVLTLLGDAAGMAPRVLDLGAGTGLLSALVLERFPEARLTLIDLSEGMLDRARLRFDRQPPGQVGFMVADYTSADLGGPYDAVVSALSIHHLEDADKRALFARVWAALRPGGVFINADQVAGPSLARDAHYRALWLLAVRSADVPEEELAAARERMTHDRLTPLAVQLGWLAGAGFIEVDCAYKHWSFAVFAGVRPEAPAKCSPACPGA
ncbi:MAG: class I SAM-dependent methyltransferase [Rhodospirillaceae bacterium]